MNTEELIDSLQCFIKDTIIENFIDQIQFAGHDVDDFSDKITDLLEDEIENLSEVIIELIETEL